MAIFLLMCMTFLNWPRLPGLQLNYAGCVVNSILCQVCVNQHTRGEMTGKM